MNYSIPLETAVQVLQAGADQGRIDWTLPVRETLLSMQLDLAVPAKAWYDVPWWGPIDEAVRDLTVHDIYINGPGREVLIGQRGQILPLDRTINHEWIIWLQEKLLARREGQTTTLTDTAIHTGVATGGNGLRRIRFALTETQITPDGPTITLRILPEIWPTLDELVTQGILPKPAADLLVRAMRANVTLLISGGTGSGKSTLAAALKHAVAEQRAVVVQDSPELPTGDPYNDVSYVVPDGDTDSFLRCVRHALRQQPQRIIIGEGRGPELLAMIEGAATGHPGLTTIHAANAMDALLRVETYASSAPRTTESIVRSNLSKLALLIIHIEKIAQARRVTQIVELRRGSDPLPGAPYECGLVWQMVQGVLTRTDDPVRGTWAQEVLS